MEALFLTFIITACICGLVAFGWWRASRTGNPFPGGAWRKFAGCVLIQGLPMICYAMAHVIWAGLLRKHALHDWHWWILWIALMVGANAIIWLAPPLRRLQWDFTKATMRCATKPPAHLSKAGSSS